MITEYIPLVRTLIMWVPTCLFLYFVLKGFIVGFIRGKRKSLRILKRNTIVATIFLVLYLLICESNFGDKLLLQIVNLVVGGSIPSMLGLPNAESITTSTELLTSIIPIVLGSSTELASILGDSQEYLISIVNLGYHLIFGVLFSILYGIVNLIIAYIDNVFNSERKAKRRQNRRFIEGKEIETYRDKKMAGGIIGAIKGSFTGLLYVSFIGALFFMIVGDTGKNKLNEEIHFTDTTVNSYFEMYKTVESYGDYGILKVLNSVRTDEDEPLYLVIPDLLNSGTNNTSSSAFSFNIRKTISPYTAFVKEVLNTMVTLTDESYNDINEAFNTKDFTSLKDKYFNLVATDEEVQAKLIELVDKFPETTSVSTLATGVIESVLSSDVLDSFPEQISDPLKIAFSSTKCNSIAEEFAMSKDAVLPCIKVSNIIKFNDIKSVLVSVLSYIRDAGKFELPDFSDPIQLASLSGVFTSGLKSISIFNEDNKETINPVLSRLYYYYLENYIDYLEVSTTKNLVKRSVLSEEDYLKSIKEDVDWIGEVNGIFSIINDASIIFSMYKEYQSEHEDAKVEDCIGYLLFVDKDNNIDNLSITQNVLEKLASIIYDSRILGKLLSSNLGDIIIGLLNQALATTSSVGLSIPDDFSFVNVYKNGELVKYGETYYILKGVISCINGESANSLTTILSLFNQDEQAKGENDPTKSSDAFSKYIPIITLLTTKDKNNETPLTYLASSTLVRSFLAWFLKTNEQISTYVSIPDQCLEVATDGTTLNIIKKDDFTELVNILSNILTVEDNIEMFNTFIGGSSPDLTKLMPLLNGENGLLSSKILQGTLGKLMISLLSGFGDYIVIPKEYENSSMWISNDPNKRSEIEKLVDALGPKGLNIISYLTTLGQGDSKSANDNSNLLDLIDLSTLLERKLIGDEVFDGDEDKWNEEHPNNLYDPSKVTIVYPLDNCLESDIIHYSLSNILQNVLFAQFGSALQGIGVNEIVVPNICTNKEYIVGSTSQIRIISKLEIKSMLTLIIKSGLLSGDLNLLKLFVTKDDKDNYLIMNSYIMIGIASQAIPSMLTGTYTYSNSYNEALNNLKYMTSSSTTYQEVYSLVCLIGDLYEQQSDKDNATIETLLSGDNISSILLSLLSDSSKMEKYLGSEFVRNLSTTGLDQKMQLFVSTEVIELAKENGVYKYSEIKSVLDYMELLGIDLFSGVIDFNGVELLPIPSEYAYNSYYLLRGFITSKIPSGIVVPSKALDTYSILKIDEINTITSIASGKTINELSSMFNDFGIDDLDDYIVYVYDSNKECKSYILLNVISDALENNDEIKSYIPSDAKSDGMIKNSEVYIISKYIGDLTDSNSDLKEVIIKNGLEIFKSKILNSYITSQFNAFGSNFEVNADKITVDGTVKYLKDTEYSNFIVSLKIFKREDIDLSSISFNDIKKLESDDLDYILNCSILRHMISNMLETSYSSITSSYSKQDKDVSVYDMSNMNSTTTKSYYSKSQLKTIIDLIKNMS